MLISKKAKPITEIDMAYTTTNYIYLFFPFYKVKNLIASHFNMKREYNSGYSPYKDWYQSGFLPHLTYFNTNCYRGCKLKTVT